jgi:hypothetical protein
MPDIRDPEPPENVRMVFADGRHVPVSCIYEGWNGKSHVWRIVDAPDGLVTAVEVATLPARTTVVLPW